MQAIQQDVTDFFLSPDQFGLEEIFNTDFYTRFGRLTFIYS